VFEDGHLDVDHATEALLAIDAGSDACTAAAKTPSVTLDRCYLSGLGTG
jgi:hypothetical protein